MAGGEIAELQIEHDFTPQLYRLALRGANWYDLIIFTPTPSSRPASLIRARSITSYPPSRPSPAPYTSIPSASTMSRANSANASIAASLRRVSPWIFQSAAWRGSPSGRFLPTAVEAVAESLRETVIDEKRKGMIRKSSNVLIFVLMIPSSRVRATRRPKRTCSNVRSRCDVALLRLRFSLLTQRATIRAQLVFVGWMPSRLSDAVPSELKDVVDYFKQLNRFMRVDLYDLGLWNPDEETIERLRFIADRRSVVIFQEAFLDAADYIGTGVESVGHEKPRSLGPPADYPAALARLREITSSGRSSQSLGPDQRRLAWGEVQKLLDQQVIHPIRKYALATYDPVERSSLMGIAELSQVFHTRVVLMNEKLNWQISERSIEHVDPLPDDQLKDLLATADRIINMTKVTERCSQPRAAILQSKTIDSQNFPRLPHSG